jgi:hypothetical protein
MSNNELPTAKPTQYRGVTYRSLLEARWACFLHHADREAIYEPETFHLGEVVGGYRPDFWIPTVGFLEVKGTFDRSVIKPLHLGLQAPDYGLYIARELPTATMCRQGKWWHTTATTERGVVMANVCWPWEVYFPLDDPTVREAIGRAVSARFDNGDGYGSIPRAA